MALSNQVQMYTVDTSAFYNEQELKIHNKINKRQFWINKLIKINKSPNEKITKLINKNKSKIKEYKSKLKDTFELNNCIRNLRPEVLSDKKIISVFESTLNRTMKLETNVLTENIFIIQTFYYKILQDIILNGFMFKGEKYVIFTASAGQIRTKKTVFIKESILEKYKDSLMCGLTVEKIGEININKYLAYLALCNSATDKWIDFNINKTIVVDDMDTNVRGVVDFIDHETYEITRQEMDIPISHTDGCGMILPNKSKKNFMVRLPWIKGLLVSFPFDKFIIEKQGNRIIKDIYGVEHDILKEGIEVILTKSQFKMWSYYSSWDEYKNFFEKYNCEASLCNLEENHFKDARLNYQMLQTLSDMTDIELDSLAKNTNDNIANIGIDKRIMLKVLGLTSGNIDKNYLQKSIEKYPELLSDKYTKEILRDIKKSLVKDGYAGKLHINAKYTFISPDLYAFCEYLFLNNKNPNGLLNDGEVYCNLYKDFNKLDCLRSPSLYREHAVRKNVIDDEKSKWFTTHALYVSCKDLISKIIMNDWDGDTSLVCAEPLLVEVAERNMKDVVPLFYNMAKAGKISLNNKNIYSGLKEAYSGGNIGIVSNDITKIWNGDILDKDAINAIKLRCMESNFTIDYAKTLYKPERPVDKNKLISKYTKSKLPHFFIYAKDKTKKQVEKPNNSVVNRLKKIIKNKRINFQQAGIGKFNYKNLMFNKNVIINDDDAKEIIKLYKKLDLQKHFILDIEDNKYSNFITTYMDIKNQILAINSDVSYVTDVLIEYLFGEQDSRFKTTLWSCFGDVIYENLCRNTDGKYKYCDICGDMIELTSNRMKYCETCFVKKRREQVRINVKNHRKNKNVIK